MAEEAAKRLTPREGDPRHCDLCRKRVEAAVAREADLIVDEMIREVYRQ